MIYVVYIIVYILLLYNIYVTLKYILKYYYIKITNDIYIQGVKGKFYFLS